MTETMHIAREMSAVINAPLIERALRCVQKDAALCLEPSPWPTRPSAFAIYPLADLKDIAKRVMAGARGQDDRDYEHMQGWMLQRAGIRAVNESRLRGLLWCIATLESEEEAGEERATPALKTARMILTTKWRAAIERHASLEVRAKIATDCVEHMHEESFR